MQGGRGGGKLVPVGSGTTGGRARQGSENLCCGQSLLGPVEGEGTQGLQLSPGVQAVSGLRLSCASLRESVRSWDGAALTGLPSACRPSAVSADGVQKVILRLCPGPGWLLGLGVLAAFPPPLGEQAVGRRPPACWVGRWAVSASWNLRHVAWAPLWGQCRASWGRTAAQRGARGSPGDALARISGWTLWGS